MNSDVANESEIVAYIDESRKPVRNPKTNRVADEGDHYVVAAAVLLAGDITAIRRSLVALAGELTAGRPFRWKDMRATTRRAVVGAISAMDGWEGFLYETATAVPSHLGSDAYLRAKTLTTAFEDLSQKHGVSRAVLETRSQPASGFTSLDESDNRLLASLLKKKRAAVGFRIEHRGKEEAILWLADILAGSRTDYLCWADRATYPLIGHKITAIVDWPRAS